MEFELPFDVYSHILSFLQQKDLVTYDTSMTNKWRRSIFLEAIQIFANKLHVVSCYWTYVRKIKRTVETVNHLHLKYVSSECKRLTVFGDRQCVNFPSEKCALSSKYLCNNQLVYLHIDFGGRICKFKIPKIEAKQLRHVTFVMYLEDIPKNYQSELFRGCPLLETMTFVCCGKGREFTVKYTRKVSIPP
jgi:hypothetical protein